MNEADVEAVITFIRTEDGGRRGRAASGYRPAHLVNDHYLTTGVHHYYDREFLAPGESTLGTIAFITPEYYPHCLWVGKTIKIQEGANLVGYAEITRIFNPLLLMQADGAADAEA
ncbi:hypothetical protein [Paenibacillus sp. MMS18-CY102]|uniref:hypothetical protein n=1 Tax=Paenibacillus sp. MMS18-CY102 TaxID=2682849 RepID=UPI001365F868|nr:hypothetical protein [Paenibacillus sp. MMS18-CY102]MWC30269.1 hypothetical protein [Paenibacillus sp. MMS18-CY102]